jgi:hypothetical protein
MMRGFGPQDLWKCSRQVKDEHRRAARQRREYQSCQRSNKWARGSSKHKFSQRKNDPRESHVWPGGLARRASKVTVRVPLCPYANQCIMLGIEWSAPDFHLCNIEFTFLSRAIKPLPIVSCPQEGVQRAIAKLGEICDAIRNSVLQLAMSKTWRRWESSDCNLVMF